MPKLNLIKFGYYLGASQCYSFTISNEKEKLHLRLENVTTIQFTCAFVEDKKHWIISLLPNLKHFILSSAYLPSIDNQLSSILNQRIQRLDIDQYSKLNSLANRYYVYFSNVQYIYFYFNYIEKEYQCYADLIIKILTNFKTLLIYITSYQLKLNKLIQYLNINTIIKNYKLKHFHRYALFIKWQFNNNEIQDITPVIL